MWKQLKQNHLVSIHASTREATLQNWEFWADSGFNPRLHEGGDYPFDAQAVRSGVSIHASTREATLFPFLFSFLD